MATTTNYGWQTPDDTALVKDGASAIRTLGSSVDTTTKALNPSTTLGDIEYRSATANTNTRLPLGTAGQVLTVNSGATAPEWATSSSGGMTLLASGSIAASITGIDLTSISQSYKELWLYITNYSNNSANSMRLRVNGNTNSDYNRLTIRSGNTSVDNASGASAMQLTDNIDNDQVGQSAIIRFPNYANTTGWKIVDSHATFNNESSYKNAGMIKATAAIDRITILLNGGAFDSGTYELFGVK
jgi:hypothetical protein